MGGVCVCYILCSMAIVFDRSKYGNKVVLRFRAKTHYNDPSGTEIVSKSLDTIFLETAYFTSKPILLTQNIDIKSQK